MPLNRTKAGFVTIIGKPNAGKSTLMNALTGAPLSIITPKPQTTRRQVSGILTRGDIQIVFIDTPGVLKPRYKLQEAMMKTIRDALAGADVLLIIVEANKISSKDELPPELNLYAEASGKPNILLLNKIDLIADKKNLLPLIEKFAKAGLFAEIIPISATEKINIDNIIASLEKYLPESDFYYEAEQLSYHSERFFCSEIIRETVFLTCGEEIPYSTEVLITEFKEQDARKLYISAEVIVERTSQKKIIIGAKGSKIKEIGVRSRIKIEEFLGVDVFLELFVKVRANWRNNDALLRSYGY